MKKRVLFIGIGFYDYDLIIQQAIEKLGFEVDYFCETPKTITYTISNHLKIRSISNRIKSKHSILIATKCKENYDFIFVIKGDVITPESLEIIRQKNKTAKTILYLWDSIKRMSNYKKIESYFDTIYSFDRVDSLNDNKLKFKPLFYRSEYKRDENNHSFLFDLFFIGWAHSDRATLLQKIASILEEQKLKVKFFIFVGKMSYYISKSIRTVGSMTIRKPISPKAVVKYSTHSRAVLDLAHPLQTGLTMRTIEVLFGINRKLITTNKDIANYSFYNENNILIINRENLEIPKSFFEKDFIPYPKEIIDSFFIENWVKDFFYEDK
jgi:putative lipopolysaccharide biosynthesis protein